MISNDSSKLKVYPAPEVLQNGIQNDDLIIKHQMRYNSQMKKIHDPFISLDKQRYIEVPVLKTTLPMINQAKTPKGELQKKP